MASLWKAATPTCSASPWAASPTSSATWGARYTRTTPAPADLNIGITAHSIFGGPGSGPTFKYPVVPGAGAVHTSGADPVGYVTRFSVPMGRNMAQMMFTGVFERFRRLQIYFAETQAGWIPHF